MSPESDKHYNLKKIFEEKLRDWFGASIEEYYDSGHKLDVYAVTPSGLKLYVEIVWSRSNLKSDMLILERSDADIKVVVANPLIINNEKLVREFNKTVISQKKKGTKIWGVMINGERILRESDYIDSEIKQIFNILIDEERDIEAEYNFEREIFKIVNNESKSKELRDSLSLLPTIEIFIGQRHNPTNWLGPDNENRWLVGTFPHVINVTGRGDKFECDTYKSTFLRVYTNGIFHLITPTPYDNVKNRYYLSYLYIGIIEFLIYAIRIMKYKNISRDYSIFIFLRNTEGMPIHFSPRHFGGIYNFSDDPKNKFSYNFHSNENWSNYKQLLFHIYRDLCLEMGALSILDRVINDNINSIIKGMTLLRKTHKYENFILPPVPIEELMFAPSENQQ